MVNTPLSEHGLEVTGDVHWNLGWEELHEMAVSRKEAKYTSHGVLLATTGERTGRSPNDRFIVKEPGLADEVWWGQVNRPISPEKFERLLDKTRKHLNEASDLFVKDAFCGADPEHTMPVRLVSEKAWHAAFMHNMFVRVSEEDLRGHIPEYTILHAPNLRANPNQDGTNSGVFVVLSNLTV